MKENIENMIYEIRGKQVMFDSDLARLYECKNGTKEVNQAVKNNIEKFPERYAFRITEEETANLKSKILTSSYGGSRKGHTVFTEQGVAMLATILHTSVATEISIRIMDAFVAMKHYISNNELRLSNVESKVLAHDSSIKLLEDMFNKFDDKNDELYFRGKKYDAYSKILDIFKEAKEELIIVDRFTDKTILDMVKDLKVKVILITGNKTKITKLDIDKYNSTYSNLSIYYSDIIHDRYIVIDKNKIYHSGNSINNIGYRGSSIDIMNDISVKTVIMKEIKSIILSTKIHKIRQEKKNLGGVL